MARTILRNGSAIEGLFAVRLAYFLGFCMSANTAFAHNGAVIPWIPYEAESMTLNGGRILGPPPQLADKNATRTNSVEWEASGSQCVKLSAVGHYVQFAARAAANALVVRYSVPDTDEGAGADYTLSLYLNGTFARKIPVSSRYAWLYGAYPFSNNPNDGRARNFYDEARLSGLSINSNDLVRLQVDADDTAPYYVIDLVDLENVGPSLAQPANSRNVRDSGVVGDGVADDTAALSNCVAAGGTVWVPPGHYLVSGVIKIPAGTTIQGAGMWYTTFVGDPARYVSPTGRIRFSGGGSNIHFADFAIVGKLNYRNDSQANDGFGETFGTNSSLARIWVEHTKTGAWIVNSQGMTIDSCRLRNTLADGINLCIGVNSTTITNCTARNTGDDGFAIWPAIYARAVYDPGSNVITHCTVQSPFLANGCAIYGGRDNRIEDCLIRDIPKGAGILIAGTFPVGDYVFRGVTTIQRCDLVRCGGLVVRNDAKVKLAASDVIVDGIPVTAQQGVTGEYGFISSAALGPQPEADARARVATMARDYGIREFMLYDWFADYSTPVRGTEWKDAFFRRHPISLATIRISVDEIHRQGGRAWAYIQCVAAEENDLESPTNDIRKLITDHGKWYWHPPGDHPRFPAYLPNAAWARFMVERWAPAVKEIGFDGIHWDTLGHIAGDKAAETRGIHDFVETAYPLLERRGLRQTVNFVGMNWWDRDLVRRCCEFPYVEVWSTQTEKQYYAEMDSPGLRGVRGVMAMYPTTLRPADKTETDIIIARHDEARRHNLVYLIVGDGERRMRTEYWPQTIPLNDSERMLLRQHGAR